MIKSNQARCPACNRINKEKPHLISRKTFNSMKGFKYLKCKFCKTIYLFDKKMTSERLSSMNQNYWNYKKI